jgi:hypothetical protein
MGKKNNNMLIYGAIALIAIVYILYKLLYAKEGFSGTNPTVESCSSLCPNDNCYQEGGNISCSALYFAERDSRTNEYTCNINGYKGVLYDTTLNRSNLQRINLREPIVPICYGMKFNELLHRYANNFSFFSLNIARDYESKCDPDRGEISLVKTNLAGERQSFIYDASGDQVFIDPRGHFKYKLLENGQREYLQDENSNKIRYNLEDDGVRYPFSKPICLSLKTVTKGKEKTECRSSSTTLAEIILKTKVQDKDYTRKICGMQKVDTGEPDDYTLPEDFPLLY